MKSKALPSYAEGLLTDIRRQDESDLIEELGRFLCGHVRGKDERQYVAEILDELERRAHGRELGEDLEAEYVYEH